MLLQPVQWQSDGTYLVSQHNKAMRHHNPTSIVQEPLDPKKKAHHTDEDDQHPAAHSKYSSDTSLHSLRELRQLHFPEEREASRAELAHEAEVRHQLDVVADLKAGLRLSHIFDKYHDDEE
jgi:hypothetical protein